MGYHTRTEYNKLILSIIDEPEKVNPDGGFLNFGVVRGTTILVSGSVLGPKKRLIRFNKAIRPSKKLAGFVPSLDYISTKSQQ
jgi:large subunit ribosomal protein L3